MVRMNTTRPAWAGIGSRETPAYVLRRMTALAHELSQRGALLRTGACTGADQAFAEGAAPGSTELYLPWPSYEAEWIRKFGSYAVTMTCPSGLGIQIAAEHHPNWEECTSGAQLLHGRNSHILLGPECTSPVKVVICWTKGGRPVGGTGQGLRIAKEYEIPVVNLAKKAQPTVGELVELLGLETA